MWYKRKNPKKKIPIEDIRGERERKTKEILAYKLQNPKAKIEDIAKKFDVPKSTTYDIINRETKKIDYNEIIENAKTIVKTGQKIVLEKLQQLDQSDIETQSDLNLLTSSLKNSQALINMIENNQTNNPQGNIPVNIQVNIDNNGQVDVQEAKTDKGEE